MGAIGPPPARRAARVGLTALGLAAAFGAGALVGRGRPAPPEPDAERAFEIREGRSGYINPLLECEIPAHRPLAWIRPFESELTARIDKLEREPSVERIAVYYRDLNNGPWVGVHERQRFIPASLAKLPILLAVLARADSDPGFLSRRLRHEGLPEERDPGFRNPEVNLVPGESYTVEELVRRVAMYSDNASARLLRQALDPGAVEQVYGDLGLDPAVRPDEAAISPREYGAFFRVLYNSSYVSREMSSRALEFFDRSTFELGLVAGVPAGTPVAHKYGVWEREGAGPGETLQLHDCGIVYHPSRPYLLCVMTKGSNYVRMASAIAEVSGFVWEQVSGPAAGGGAP